MPTRRDIVRGQPVNPIKVERAKALRREMTPEERTLWQELRRFRDRGYVFRRQQVIDGFIADFYCHRAGLVVEIDGAYHRVENGPDYDAERDHIIKARNLQVLRFSNDDVRNRLTTVLGRINDAATAASPPLPLGEGAGG